MLYSVVQFIALFLLMLVTGIFWGPWFSLHRSLKVFNKDEFLHIVNTLADNLANPMRIMMPLCIVSLLLVVCFYPHTGTLGFYLSVLAFILTIVSLVVTLVVEVPLVNQFKQWSASTLPPDWETIRDSWVRFHVVRTFSSLASFASLVISVLLA